MITNPQEYYGSYRSPQTFRSVDTMRGKPFSPSESRIYDRIIQGQSNPRIAQALGLSVNTVSQHLTSIYKKLGIKTLEQRKALRS